LGTDDWRRDNQASATGWDAHDTEGLELASGLLGNVMHCIHFGDREGITWGNACRCVDSHGLEAVVYVDLATDGGRCGLRSVVCLGVRAIGVDTDTSTTSSRSDTVGVVELVGIEASDHTDEVALVGFV